MMDTQELQDHIYQRLTREVIKAIEAIAEGFPLPASVVQRISHEDALKQREKTVAYIARDEDDTKADYTEDDLESMLNYIDSVGAYWSLSPDRLYSENNNPYRQRRAICLEVTYSLPNKYNHDWYCDSLFCQDELNPTALMKKLFLMCEWLRKKRVPGARKRLAEGGVG